MTTGGVRAGRDFQYTIKLSLRKGTLTGVRADCVLPPEVEFRSAQSQPPQALAADYEGTLSWDLGDLHGPARLKLQVAVHVPVELPAGTPLTVFVIVRDASGQTNLAMKQSRVRKVR